MYKDCSKIEEYRTREVVRDPADYDFDVNKLIIKIIVWGYDEEGEFNLYIFKDGSIATGTVIGMQNRNEHHLAIKALNNDTAWKNVGLIYWGKMSGQDLYELLLLREKANFDGDYFDSDIEYERMMGGLSLPVEKKYKTTEVNPWITAINYDNGNDQYFFIQAADGIRHYLYDKNAQQMLYSIEDSWYFDQWMNEIYGEDWRSKVTLYRTEDDFVYSLYTTM